MERKARPNKQCKSIDDTANRVAEIEKRYPTVPVYLTSARGLVGLDSVRSVIRRGIIAALVGSSGVGKSTLIDALLGEERMATGDVSARDGRGCHITSRRQLLRLRDGGMVPDTPGMRELQLLDDTGIKALFSDIDEISARCRFRDCHHIDEPGCAVKQVVTSGQIFSERLEHFMKLEREAVSFERRHNAHLRRKSERVWGKLHEEAERIRRWKRYE